MTNKRNKKLTKIRKKTGGRDSTGRVSVRSRGGEHKRFIRKIDWKRDKIDIPGKVKEIRYDPNRSANLGLVVYKDGEKRFILAPAGLEVGDTVIASKNASIEPGNCLPLEEIPIGVEVHNLEIKPGKGGQMVRGAGTAAILKSKREKMAKIELPSGEIRLFNLKCWATIGQVGNVNHIYKKLKKAGDSRHRGKRPTVRGVAQHPSSHPHGGGHVHNIGLKAPKTPWGKKAMGKKTRKKNKYSDKYIISRKKK
jgi:large subunit ribosomal protein L2